MGYFKNIKLLNYRNFSDRSFDFNGSCNVLIGKNGSGKTNILEAISLFEKGRGFRKEKIINLINFKNLDQGFNIQTIFQNQNSDYKISVFNSEQNLKKISVNDSLEKESIKFFESLFSIICFLPEMERLFLSSPSFRRNFLDRLIFSFDKRYNFIVNNYKKSIYERQILLKNNEPDESWLYKLEQNIVEFGSTIYQKRINHISHLNKILKEINLLKEFTHSFYLKLEDDLIYQNDKIENNNELYLQLLKNSREKDLFLNGCSIGPHRSDFRGFSVKNDFNVNQFSTGQQKTAILLIIIAHCKHLREHLNLKPIILLDEVCSHLDNFNRELLLYVINELNAQIFMTGTEKSFFSFLSTKAQYYNIT